MPGPDPLIEARRFYKEARAGEETGGAFPVLLDGRRARTARGSVLATPTRALAELVAGEWDAQGPSIEPADMPATRLASQVLDGGEEARAVQTKTLDSYGASDLICYFADSPRALVERQERSWGSLLDWAKSELGLEFTRATGIIHREQPLQTLAGLTELARAAAPFELAGLAFGAGLFGSAVISLALRAGRLDAAGAMDAARLDEIFQEEQWGVDAEARERAEAMAAEARLLELWFRAL
ncbi:MAG TPA: ATP12 family protein [Caulobacteraceae bacterium]|jgi:chaperone required for assembly of F1-ATPase|nr:ATP12 family protein [Caulobacteraceae bacterium]